MIGQAYLWAVEVQEYGNDERTRWLAVCTSPEAAEAALRLLSASVGTWRRKDYLGGGWVTKRDAAPYRTEVVEAAWEWIKDEPLPIAADPCQSEGDRLFYRDQWMDAADKIAEDDAKRRLS